MELASGVDALYLSGHGYLSKGFLARLEEHRLWADRVSMALPFELGPLTFGLAPHGWGKYRYCLDHESGRIGFTSSRRIPALRIRPRAEFLQARGPGGTVTHFEELLGPLVENLAFSVARIDLFCDLDHLELCAEDRPGFVCRANACTMYQTDRVCTGFAFGSRRTQHICARIYDKTAEMEAKGTDWWEAVWAERHLVGERVWRIEFEIDRAALSDLELSRPDDVVAAVPSLWRYCSSDWLTLRLPTADSNRSRWPSTRAGGPCSRPPSSTGRPSCGSSEVTSGPRRCADSCRPWWAIWSASPSCRGRTTSTTRSTPWPPSCATTRPFGA